MWPGIFIQAACQAAPLTFKLLGAYPDKVGVCPATIGFIGVAWIGDRVKAVESGIAHDLMAVEELAVCFCSVHVPPLFCRESGRVTMSHETNGAVARCTARPFLRPHRFRWGFPFCATANARLPAARIHADKKKPPADATLLRDAGDPFCH